MRSQITYLFFIILTFLAIIIFWSWRQGGFEWFLAIKQGNLQSWLFPILSLIIGCFGTVLSGNLMQYTTRNNLSSPFTMGILPSASLSVAILRIFGVASLWLSLFLGWTFSILILLIVVFISYKQPKSEMIVIGLALGMIVLGINFLLSLKLPDNQIIFKWFSNGSQNWTKERLMILGPPILAGGVISFLMRDKIKAYKRSPIKAMTTGINCKLLICTNYVIVSIVSVATTFLIGEIAFIGMAVPNITRIILKSDNFLLNIGLGTIIAIPLLIFSLAISNVYLLNYQLMTTLVCAPLFVLILMIRSYRE